MPVLDVEQGSLYFDTHGQGPTCIVLHGAGQSSDYLRPGLDALGAMWKLAYVDLRGFHRSVDRAPDAPASQRLFDDIDRLADHLGAPRFVLMGHSLGAFIALAYACARPQRVDAVVSIAGGAAWVAHGARMLELAQSRGTPPEALATFVSPPAADDAGFRAQIRSLEPMIFATCPSETRRAFFEALPLRAMSASRMVPWLSTYDVRAALGEMRVPTLAIAGDRDLLCPAFLSEEIAATAPHARCVVLPSCGHFPWMEAPSALERCVREWWREVEGGVR